jgi:putative nucleotidyltransferase with HDIG domain
MHNVYKSDREAEPPGQGLDATIGILARLLELHDPATGAHSRRVATASEFIAIQMNMTFVEINDIKRASLLHDIGKISIPAQILHNDPAKLTIAEKALINEHPVIGEDILRPIAQLENVRRIIRHHHESFSGTGRPDKLSGENIPMGSRIMAVVDHYDRILSIPSQSSPEARKEFATVHLNNNSGNLYDPAIVTVFTEFLEFKDMVDSEIREEPVELTELKDGMVLSQDLHTSKDLLVLTKDTRIGEKELKKILYFNNLSPVQKPAYIYVE